MTVKSSTELVTMTHSIDGLPETTPEVRRIWVQREGLIEYKSWFIFSWEIQGAALKKLITFLRAENRRFCDLKATPERLKVAAQEYSSVDTSIPELPPRLIAIPESKLAKMGTRLVTEGRFTYGDSVGGLAPSAVGDIDSRLRDKVNSSDLVLFSPGVLARLKCVIENEPHYLFQLAVKNLRRSGAIFYKAVGGHLKFHPAFDEVIYDLGLKVKEYGQSQDSRDLVFHVQGAKLQAVTDLFDRETVGPDGEKFFVRPIVSMHDELWEEVGPLDTSDGVSLFSDLEMRSDFLSAR
ncbi:hypothetical protein ACFWMR_28925 [Amycolatopsis thailandensis]|uniref:hypothetical protein n=1 Tax=Amycolatopsis thailandensis TaxID=589330 RepID=UPI00365BD3FB